MNDTPLVSIVIPVYNGANYLSQAIESALKQTYSNIEILVINDGSTDDGETEHVALAYKDKIRYFAKSNGGVSSALNMGIEKMNGEWFSWLSHDDLYEPEKVALEVEELQHITDRESAIVCCADRLIDKDGNKIYHPTKPLVGNYSGKEMFVKYYSAHLNINGCSLLINKSLFTRLGGFCSFKYMQDTECWIRFMLNGASFYCISNRLVAMRVHKGQVTVRFPELYYTERSVFGKIVADQLLSDKEHTAPLIRCFLAALYKSHDQATIDYIEGKIGNIFPIRKFIYWGYGSAMEFLRWGYHRFVKRAK